MYQFTIFVSSAMDELQFEREAAREVISDLSHRPELFELFPAMSESPRQAYVERVRDADLFVLILYRRFSPATFEEYQEAVAANKPIIVLVRWCSERRDDQVEQLLQGLRGPGGLTPSVRLVYKTYETLSQFKTELRHAVIYEIGKVLRPPLHTLSREEMYDLGSEIIKSSQRRVAVVQRTPSLFLGARPYCLPQEHKWSYEWRFLKVLEQWIECAVQDSGRSLLYAYSPTDSRQHVASQDETARNAILQRCRESIPKYKAIERDSGLRLRFFPLGTTFSGPLAIGDNRVAFWLLGDEDAVSIQQENSSIANVVFRMLRLHSAPHLDAEALLQGIISQEQP